MHKLIFILQIPLKQETIWYTETQTPLVQMLKWIFQKILFRSQIAMNLKTITKDAAPYSSFVTAILIIASILGFFNRLFAVITNLIHMVRMRFFRFWGFLRSFFLNLPYYSKNIAPFDLLGVYLKIKVPREVKIDEKFN